MKTDYDGTWNNSESGKWIHATLENLAAIIRTATRLLTYYKLIDMFLKGTKKPLNNTHLEHTHQAFGRPQSYTAIYFNGYLYSQ